MGTYPLDACPDCGAQKGVKATRCRRCAGRVRRTAKHGTDSRYVRHLADGEPACEPCLRAHAVAVAADDRVQRAARRRARQQARAVQLVCPDCGEAKSRKARQCVSCSRKGGYRGKRAEHGTDSGYFRHVRKPDPDNGWPRTACAACLAAHAAAERDRTGGQPAPRREPKTCLVCGVPVTPRATYCRSHGQSARRDTENKPPPRSWIRVGMIWKAAS